MISIKNFITDDPHTNEAIQDIMALGLVEEFDELAGDKRENSEDLIEFLQGTYDILREEYGIDARTDVLKLLLEEGIKARDKNDLVEEVYFTSLDTDQKIGLTYAEAGTRANEKDLLEKMVDLFEEDPLVYVRVDGAISQELDALVGSPIRRR